MKTNNTDQDNRKLFLGIAFAMLVMIFVSLAWAAPGRTDLTLKQQARSVVRYWGDASSTCSVVVVAPGKALTAKHCGGLTSAKVDGKHEVTRWKILENQDLMLLDVRGLECPCAKPASRHPVEDEEVWMVGYPGGAFKTLSVGFFQAIVLYEEPPDYREVMGLVSGAVFGGASGGGVFILEGGEVRLVGIISRAIPGVLVLYAPLPFLPLGTPVMPNQ